MCGIVGYIGDKNITSVLLVGLERLSYRGYDSSGIAVITEGELSWWKRPGKIHELENTVKGLNISGHIGIGHTRWATHGQPNEVNAHPHISGMPKVAIVHNGIIENYLDIRDQLISEGHVFQSETDSEVIVKLVEKYLPTSNNLESALESAISHLHGTYGLAALSETEPEKIVVCRKGSPIIIGLGDNENYVASDINAIIQHTKKIVYLDENQIAIVERNSVRYKTVNGGFVEKTPQVIKWDSEAAEKQGYPHYMLKEIFEQPTVVRTILEKYVGANNQITFKDLRISPQIFKQLNRFIIQACGTSWHAGIIGKYLLESYAKVFTEVDFSSEFRYRQMLTEGSEVVIAVSQSGETADTLACIREAKLHHFPILSFVNVKNSSMDRESDGVIYSHAGQEIGVASTKNYLAQLVCFLLFTLYIGRERGTISEVEVVKLIAALQKLPEYISSVLDKADQIKAIAEKYGFCREFLFIGRGLNYPTALEGALKLKEISYIHSTGYAAGELKHGPIALIDSKLPVVCICPASKTYDKMVSNIQEVKARRGKTIVIATEGDTTIKAFADDIIYIPQMPEELTPIVSIVPLQLLSYYVALSLDCDVDQPRNLAKSVTVE